MPWKWEILKEQLVTAGRQSFAAQAQAHDAGQAVLAEIIAKQEAAQTTLDEK